jgi:hypothetical protein
MHSSSSRGLGYIDRWAREAQLLSEGDQTADCRKKEAGRTVLPSFVEDQGYLPRAMNRGQVIESQSGTNDSRIPWY